MSIFDFRPLRYFDWIHFLLIISISCMGLLFIYSATFTPEKPFSIFFLKQCGGVLGGICIYLICTVIDCRATMRWGSVSYLAVIGLLIFTLIKGSIGMGAQRWINLFFFKLQPSELTKLFLPCLVAHYCEGEMPVRKNMRFYLPLLAVIGISFILIRKQPDLGTACIVLFTGTILVWIAGISRKFFIATGLVLLCGAPMLWHVLKPYQKDRILVFLGHGSVHKERYQIEQAIIAIGSGGIMGKGFLHGTQNRLRFLPESRTDFIFAVIAEELGFLGVLFLLLLFAILFTRICYRITHISDVHMQLLAVGMVMHILLSMIINIAMVLNLLPVVGIPLPLVSYGVCNLWITFASLGCFQSVVMRYQAYGSSSQGVRQRPVLHAHRV